MPPPLSRLLLLLAGFARLVDAQGDCMPQGSVAIFMVYQAENPDSVFFSEDGCLAGGGRGTGCCAGAQCRVCEPNQVTSAGGKLMRWNSCQCEPCPPGSVQFRVGQNTCIECPAGWYQPVAGQTNAYSAAGDVQPVARGVRDVQRVSARDVLQVRDPRVSRGHDNCTARRMGQSLTTRRDATSCTECPAGTHQPSPRGRNGRLVLTGAPRGRTRTAERHMCSPCPAGDVLSRTRTWSGEEACLPCQAGRVLRQRRQRGLLPVLPDRQPRVRRVHEARAGLLRDPVVVLQRRQDGAGAHGQVLGFPQGALPQRLHQVRRRQLVRHRDVFHHRVTSAVSLFNPIHSLQR